MAYLVDSNVLVRLANSADPQHTIATKAVVELHGRRERLHLTPQVLIEFRSVAMRPVAQNGLGLSPAKTEAKAVGFEAAFPLLPDTADVYTTWKLVVSAFGTIGKQVHDARLIAVCNVHAMTHLLTFNLADFARTASYGPGVTIIDPAAV
jgi:predicted nucleic acid-binding protein